MSPQQNIIEQSRNNTVLLTRVPKIPLYVLIGLKGVYALASLVLACLVVTFSGPTEAQEVKARLTVEGLAAGLLEPAANQERAVKRLVDSFGEHNKATKEEPNKKVGVKQTPSGGWVWVATQVVTGLGINTVAGTVFDNAANNGDLGEAGHEIETLRQII